MLFKIITETETYYYNNTTNELFNSSKVLIDLSWLSKTVLRKPENPVEPFDIVDNVYPFPKKDKKLRQLKIQVGTNCNQKCVYCIQADKSMKASSTLPNKADIDAFFTALDSAGIELCNWPKIHLWGGEPLVYWKTLIVLIPAIRKRWPDAQIWFVSNGTLINSTKLRFLLEHRVELAFSHDGQAQFLRGYNPLEDKILLGLWRQTKEKYAEAGLSFRLNTVLSQYNTNLYALDSYFTNKLGESISYKYEDVVIAHSKNAIEFTKFTKPAENNLIFSIEKALTSAQSAADLRISNALYPFVFDFIRRLVYKVPADAIKAKCNAVDSDVLSVDLKTCNVLSCHNVAVSDWSMGSLLDYNSIKVNKFRHWSVRDNCPSCPYLSICKGGCIRNNDELHKHSCNDKIVLNKAIFNAVFKLLFNCRVKEIVHG